LIVSDFILFLFENSLPSVRTGTEFILRMYIFYR
jgi:hypothetical protein